MHTADQLGSPVLPSSSVSYLLLTALDHLDAVRILAANQGGLHYRSPYSLVRGAIEGAGTALYLMRDGEPRALTIAAMRLFWTNVQDAIKTYDEVGGDGSQLDNAKRRLHEAIDRIGADRREVLARPPGVLAILRQVRDAYSLPPGFVFSWQLCSAATHGREWASGVLSPGAYEKLEWERTRVDDKETMVLVALNSACILMKRATDRWEELARPVGHLGQSFGSSIVKREPFL